MVNDLSDITKRVDPVVGVDKLTPPPKTEPIKSLSSEPTKLPSLVNANKLPEYNAASNFGSTYDQFGLSDSKKVVDHHSYGTQNSKYNFNETSPKTTESLTEMAQKPANFRGNVNTGLPSKGPLDMSNLSGEAYKRSFTGLDDTIPRKMSGSGYKPSTAEPTLSGYVKDAVSKTGGLWDTLKNVPSQVDKYVGGAVKGLVEEYPGAYRAAQNLAGSGINAGFLQGGINQTIEYGLSQPGHSRAYEMLNTLRGGSPEQVVVKDPKVQAATLAAKDKDRATTQTSAPVYEGKIPSDFVGPVNDQMREADKKHWYPETPTPSGKEFPNQPGVSAMTPAEFMGDKNHSASNPNMRPSDYLKPILHAALLAKPGTQQAIDAHEAFNSAISMLDGQHGKQLTPVDPKTGERYEVSGGPLPFKNAGAPGGSLVSSSDTQLARDAETARLAAGHNGADGDRMRERASEGLILNPKYQHGFGSSQFNDTPGANRLPDDAYITPQEYRERQNTPTFTDRGAGGQRVPGMVAQYNGQGGLVNTRQFDVSPEARAKAEAGNVAREERANDPTMKVYDTLRDQYYDANALSRKTGGYRDEMNAVRAKQALAEYQAGPMATAKASDDAAKAAASTAQIARMDKMQQHRDNLDFKRESQADRRLYQEGLLASKTGDAAGSKDIIAAGNYINGLSNDSKDPDKGLRTASALYKSPDTTVSGDLKNPTMMAVHARQFQNYEKAAQAYNKGMHLPGFQAFNTDIYLPEVASQLTGDVDADVDILDKIKDARLGGAK